MSISIYRVLAAGLSLALLLLATVVTASPARPTPAASQGDGRTEEATSGASGDFTATLTDDDDDGTWTGSASTGAGVNIIGATWTAAPSKDAPADDDSAEDADDAGHADDQVGTARFRTGTKGSWSPWQDMVVSDTEVSTGTEGDLVMGALDIQIEVAAQATDVELTIWTVPPQSADVDALTTRADGSALGTKYGTPDASASAEATSSPGLTIGTRAQWGADESLRKWSPNYIDGTQGVTIHHTAGTNNYSAEQVPAILRGIYQYHAVTRDWGDVGYNMFVDRFGRAWEGRRGGPETSLRAAHALGMNDTTAGISLIGNYNTADVPKAAFDGLARVTSWKLLTHDIARGGTFVHENEAEGWTRTLSVISAHREVGQTSGPGDRLYARMGEFRSKVRSYDREVTAMQRVSGSDRYATAAELAAAAHPFGVDTVYITRGDDIIESLTVGAAAARNDDALLLTRSSSLPAATARQIKLLEPDEVIVVAEASRITPSVIAQISAVTDAPITRVRSTDQYDLAAGLAGQWSQSSVVYVASGQEPADALAGGAAAAHDDAPLLLSTDRAMPASTQQELARLQPREVVLLGGTARIPASAVQDVRRNVPGAVVTRIAGADRYATAALVSGQRFEDSPRAFLANGRASIDAIAGTQYAAASDSPVLLTSKACHSAQVDSAMSGLDADLRVLLGGRAQLDDASASAVCR